MKLPPLMDEELKPFLEEGLWVAKLATHNPDGSVRITPMEYAVDDGCVMFSTWKNSAAVRNASRDPRSSVLIDRAERPFAGVHYTGTAEVLADDVAAEQYGEWFKRYVGDYEQAVESYKFLVSLGIGERAFIRFRPQRTITWDMSKIPGG